MKAKLESAPGRADVPLEGPLLLRLSPGLEYPPSEGERSNGQT